MEKKKGNYKALFLNTQMKKQAIAKLFGNTQTQQTQYNVHTTITISQSLFALAPIPNDNDYTSFIHLSATYPALTTQ